MKLIIIASIIFVAASQWFYPTMCCFPNWDHHTNWSDFESQPRTSFLKNFGPDGENLTIGVESKNDNNDEDGLSAIVIEFRQLLRFFYGDYGFIEFIKYGHYCGYNGDVPNIDKELEPMDVCDQCCKDHVDCYGRAVDSGSCNKFEPYKIRYMVNFTSPAAEMCSGNPKESCQHFVCTCDLVMAQSMGQLHESGNC